MLDTLRARCHAESPVSYRRGDTPAARQASAGHVFACSAHEAVVSRADRGEEGTQHALGTAPRSA